MSDEPKISADNASPAPYSHFDYPEEAYQRASEEMQEHDARRGVALRAAAAEAKRAWFEHPVSARTENAMRALERELST